MQHETLESLFFLCLAFLEWWAKTFQRKGSSETTPPLSDLKDSGTSPLGPVRAAVWATKAGQNRKVMFAV